MKPGWHREKKKKNKGPEVYIFALYFEVRMPSGMAQTSAITS